MDEAENYRVNPGLGLLLTDMGVSIGNVLRRADLPHDLFARGTASLTPGQYFALWRAIEDETGDPLLPIHIGQTISVEAFDPLVFAALCSRNLTIAADRVAAYKRLIGPMRLVVTGTEKVTSLEVRWPMSIVPPASLATAELIFIVALARIATRSDVRPVRVISAHPPKATAAYREYLGVPSPRARAMPSNSRRQTQPGPSSPSTNRCGRSSSRICARGSPNSGRRPVRPSTSAPRSWSCCLPDETPRWPSLAS